MRVQTFNSKATVEYRHLSKQFQFLLRTKFATSAPEPSVSAHELKPNSTQKVGVFLIPIFSKFYLDMTENNILD
jgi:hypothetical protein